MDKSNTLDLIGCVFTFILLLNVNIYYHDQSQILKENYLVLITIMFSFAILGMLNYITYM